MPIAPWPLRLPVIRHLRYFWHVRRFNAHYDFWRAAGFIGGPQQFEIDYLNDIWSGKA